MGQWKPVGAGDNDTIRDGDAKADRQVYTNASGSGVDSAPSAVTDGFAVGMARYIMILLTGITATSVFRLYWWDTNAEAWFPETTTFSTDENHFEQRAAYGFSRCAIRCETKGDDTDTIAGWASGANDTA